MAKNFENAAGNKILKKASEINKTKLSQTIVVDIPLKEIEPNPDNELIFNMDNIESIANSIKTDGFTGAIEVFKLKNGKYQISSGHRRYEAMKMLGKETVPCIVSKDVDEVTKARKLLSSNMTNRVLTPLDYANAIEYYKKTIYQSTGKKVKKEELMEFFNLSRAQLYRYECLKSLIPELQEYTKDSSFPFTALQPAATMTIEKQKAILAKLDEYKKRRKDEPPTKTFVNTIVAEQKEKDVTIPKSANVKINKRKEVVEEDCKKNEITEFEKCKNILKGIELNLSIVSEKKDILEDESIKEKLKIIKEKIEELL